MTISKESKTYKRAIQAFSKQFDVSEITKLFVLDGKVVGGEWIDSTGMVNFNSNCFDAKVVEVK